MGVLQDPSIIRAPRTRTSILATAFKEYFTEIETAHPGALASQWIPYNLEPRKADKFLDFLAVHKEMLANEINKQSEEQLFRYISRSLPTSPCDPKVRQISCLLKNL